MLCNGWCMMWVGNLNPASCIPRSVWNWEPRVKDWGTRGFAAAAGSSSVSLCTGGLGRAEPAAAIQGNMASLASGGSAGFCLLIARDLDYGAAPCQHSPAANHRAQPGVGAMQELQGSCLGLHCPPVAFCPLSFAGCCVLEHWGA